MAEKTIKIDDLVTVPSKKYNTSANTYKVVRKLKGECLLAHPLSDDCFLLKKDKDLNNFQATLQNSIEKCLNFANKNKHLLGHSSRYDLESMIYLFVIKRELSMKQKAELSSICGKISSVMLQNNLQSAIDYINPNNAILDDHHTTLFNSVKECIKNPTKIRTKKEKFAIFSIAGFLMAQLGEKDEGY